MALWYLTRATGAATLVLLTATLALGVVDVERFTTHRFPRFVVDGWHRTTSLLVCALLALHVATSVLDAYAPIRIVDAFIPFAGSYRPVWLGLGALGLDLIVALVITSLLRDRIGVRTWRAIHWLSYACWPVALVHGLGTGSDVRPGWLLWLSVACAGVIGAAVVVRLADARASRPIRLGGTAALALAVAGLVAWLPSGPLGRGWAARAGTPAKLIGGKHR